MSQSTVPAWEPGVPEHDRPWPALWALCLGFFMILVDSTIVSVATPAIIQELGADVNSVVWVTSAYLLAYAVPVLITGRLGDRFGPKRLYLTGLTVFTLASLWCGLTGSIEELIVARVFQGLGASMMTPQTMAIITRIFPAARRGTGDGPVGRHGRGRDPGRSDPRRAAGRQSGLGVDLLRQRARRAAGVRPGLASGAAAGDPPAPIRLARGRAERDRHVPAGLRDPGGPPVRMVDDHRLRHRAVGDRGGGARPGRVRGVAGPQHPRATGAAQPVP